MRKNNHLIKLSGTAFIYLMTLVSAPAVYAAALDLTQTFPDLQLNGLAIAYDAGTDMFTASGSYSDLAINTGSALDFLPNDPVTPYVYALSAQIDGAGKLSSGALSLTHGTDTLLQAHLINFGASNGVFEFAGDQLTGSLLSQYNFQEYGGLGIIMNAGNFTGDFSTGFTAQATGVDNFPSAVPLPAAAWLFGSGLVGLVAVSSRKRHQT